MRITGEIYVSDVSDTIYDNRPCDGFGFIVASLHKDWWMVLGMVENERILCQVNESHLSLLTL